MSNYEFLYKMIPVNSKGVAACLQSKYVIEELDKERSSGKFIDAYVFCEVLERVYAEHVDKGFDPDFAKKTEEQFKKRAERAAEKAKEKEAKARRIAAKIAAKIAKKNK